MCNGIIRNYLSMYYINNDIIMAIDSCVAVFAVIISLL